MKLTYKLPILVIFLVLFLAIGYQLIFYFEIQENIIDSRISEATSLIQLSSDEIRDSVYFLDYETINLQLDSLQKNPLIKNVYVMHPDGRIISDGFNENVGFNTIPNDIFIQNSITLDTINVKINENNIQLVNPIVIVDKIGILYLEYSLEDINQILEESVLLLLIFATILSIVGIVIGFSISSSITKPIQKIKNISVELAKGNFDMNFDYSKSSTSEMNDLLKSLQEMSVNMKKHQSDLIKAERFSAIGELSAKISHDIRNPLFVLTASLFTLPGMRNNQEKFDRVVERMNGSVKRITHQVDEVMIFLQTTDIRIEEIHLKEMFDLIVSELDIVEQNVNSPKNDLVIIADKTKLTALFSNIVMNAFQAIEKNGTISIIMSEFDDSVKIEIIDDGPGIPKENVDKIFEPLFTTKQEGTGLGLASCKNTVEQHGGTISIKNNPTTFTVVLPKIQEIDTKET